MSALALAILLAGAGGPEEPQRRRELPGPPVAPLPPITTPSMAPAMPPAQPRPSQARGARAYLVAYFTMDRYPIAALRADAQGTVAFLLDIDARGAVTGCTVTESSGSAPLDEGTCAIAREARYIPARDEAGRPTGGRDRGRVTWRLPEE